jgi:hypothetical protein
MGSVRAVLSPSSWTWVQGTEPRSRRSVALDRDFHQDDGALGQRSEHTPSTVTPANAGISSCGERHLPRGIPQLSLG